MHNYDPFAVTAIFPPDGWETPAACGPNGGDCVEVNLANRGMVAMRHTRLAAGPVLVFDDQEWRAFLDAARSGQYDR